MVCTVSGSKLRNWSVYYMSADLIVFNLTKPRSPVRLSARFVKFEYQYYQYQSLTFLSLPLPLLLRKSFISLLFDDSNDLWVCVCFSDVQRFHSFLVLNVNFRSVWGTES